MDQPKIPTPHFTEEELEEMCLGAPERLERVLDGGDPSLALQCFDEIANAKRWFCEGYLDWLVLTDEFVTKVLGHSEHVRATRPERLAELAVRSSFLLEDLVRAQALLSGGDNQLEARIRTAITAGDREGTLRTWQECERLFRAVHDLRRDAISDLLGWIHAEHGPETLQDVQLYAADKGPWATFFRAELDMPPEERIRAFTFLMGVGSYSRMSVAEKDDRWVVRMLECGSCGRQLRDRYTGGDWGLAVVTGRGPLTLGTPSLTVYQTHLAVIHQIYAIGAVGAPWPVIECAGLEANDCPCELTLYKDPTMTPERFYERVGMVKPPR